MRLWKSSTRPLTFEAFGVRVEVALEDQGLEPYVREVLPPGWRPCEQSEGAGRFALREIGPEAYEVKLGDVPFLQHQPLDVALGMLDSQMRLFIAATTKDWVFVHAGTVAIDGRALLLPGESFSGKTTLTAALVQAGATYLSDEYAVLDQAGRVHPYPRRLSIRSQNGGVPDERHASELGGRAGTEIAEVALIVITRYRPAGVWSPTPISTGQGVVALMANTVPAQERPREALQALTRAARTAEVLEGERGEAGPVAADLLARLGALPG